MRKALLISLLAVLLASCSKHSDTTEKSVRILWPRDPENLDPLANASSYAADANNLLHLSLLQVDQSTQSYAPALVDSLPSITLVGDSLTLLGYQLRATAAWGDGQPVLASDIAFTLKLMQIPGLQAESTRGRFDFIREIRFDSANPRRFVLVCRGQAPEYAHESGDFFVLPERALDAGFKLRRYALATLIDRPLTAPVDSVFAKLARHYAQLDLANHPGHIPGSGPYQLVRWEKDHRLRFRRKPHWWADALQPTPVVLQANPAQIDFVVVPSEANAALALRRGTVNVYPQMPVREFYRLKSSAAAQQKLAFYTNLSYDVVTAGFNVRRPVVADRLTRQALALLFNPQDLLRANQLGLGQCTVGLIRPTDPHNYADSLSLLTFNPERATALLRQAGWQPGPTINDHWTRTGPDGVRQYLTLSVRYRTGETAFETAGLQFRAAAARLGIKVNLRPTEPSAFNTTLHAGDFDLYIRLTKGNPFSFNFAPILHSRSIGEGNLTGFGTPASDRLIEAIAAASSFARKAHLLRKFQVLLREEMPLVPLYFPSNCLVASRQLHCLYPSGIRPGYAMATITGTSAPD